MGKRMKKKYEESTRKPEFRMSISQSNSNSNRNTNDTENSSTNVQSTWYVHVSTRFEFFLATWNNFLHQLHNIRFRIFFDVLFYWINDVLQWASAYWFSSFSIIHNINHRTEEKWERERKKSDSIRKIYRPRWNFIGVNMFMCPLTL